MAVAPATSFDCLPDEVLVDILFRLSTIDLLSLRGTCCYLRETIDHEEFTLADHRRANAGYPVTMVKRCRKKDAGKLREGNNPVMIYQAEVKPNKVEEPAAAGTSSSIHPRRGSMAVTRLISCCCGFGLDVEGGEERCGCRNTLKAWMSMFQTQYCSFVCYGWNSGNEGHIIMVNPLTGKQVDLPYIDGSVEGCWCGYDPLSGRYKLLALCTMSDRKTMMSCIHTLGLDKSWRPLPENTTNKLTKFARKHKPVYFNARLFWLLDFFHPDGTGMALFDLTTETISFYNTPEDVKSYQCKMLVLGKSPNKTLFLVYSQPNEIIHKIWELDETNPCPVKKMYKRKHELFDPLWLPWGRGDIVLPEEYRDGRFMCALSDELWLFRTRSRRGRKFVSYDVVDGTMTTLNPTLQEWEDDKTTPNYNVFHLSLISPQSLVSGRGDGASSAAAG